MDRWIKLVATAYIPPRLGLSGHYSVCGLPPQSSALMTILPFSFLSLISSLIFTFKKNYLLDFYYVIIYLNFVVKLIGIFLNQYCETQFEYLDLK